MKLAALLISFITTSCHAQFAKAFIGLGKSFHSEFETKGFYNSNAGVAFDCL
jgi:hypothetical protein